MDNNRGICIFQKPKKDFDFERDTSKREFDDESNIGNLIIASSYW